MNWLLLRSGFAFGLLLVSMALAEPPKKEPKAVTIPLDQIWANGMPGTRDIDDLERENLKLTRKLIWHPIAESLIEIGADSMRRNKLARPGFAVQGTGLAALRGARTVLVDGEKSRPIFSPGTDVTLVFFSYPITSDVQLLRAERRENIIDVRYRFVGRMERNLSLRFALIPLGKLPAGKYQVKTTQMPAVQKLLNTYKPSEPPSQVNTAERFVSQPFSFEVVEMSN